MVNSTAAAIDVRLILNAAARASFLAEFLKNLNIASSFVNLVTLSWPPLRPELTERKSY